jgi:hypothetical protein
VDGFDCISDEAVAKNVLTVGAVIGVEGGYTDPAGVLMTSFSSWGPTDDGRIKPDICADGHSTYSATNESDTAYGLMSGTSMATPNVSGSLGLLVQHYRATHQGADMRAATLKALVLHTADECGDYPGPDYKFGWGLLNTNKAAGRISSDVLNDDIIREETLTQGSTFELTVQASGTHPLRATICWTDPPGFSPSASLDPPTPMLINDLNLAIRSVSTGTVYHPWVLNRSFPSAPAGRGVNDRDNVEQVYIPAPPAGEYIVEVTHSGTLQDGAQDFSLILSLAADCNGNGLDDDQDLAGGLGEDCNGNQVLDNCDPDGDLDGTIDDCDGCPLDPSKVEPGLCGCHVPDDPTDTDGDDTPDCADACPDDPDKIDPEYCGCGLPETDTDGDGTPDCADQCPHNPDKIAPDVCGCGQPDTDTDGDQTPDCNDWCYEDPDKLDPGQCGCGQPETDADGDQTSDCVDGCPSDPDKADPGLCGCGVAEQADDSDGDGTIDCFDGCPNDGDKLSPGACGCGISDADTDADGTADCNDRCPLDPNKVAPLACGCGRPETDTDADGMPDCIDVCALDPDKTVLGACGCGASDRDSDSDGVADCRDDCPADPYKRTPGYCGCGLNDYDGDGDGVPDRCTDDCPNDPGKSRPGVCGCGVADTDADTDGVADCIDNCPGLSNPDQADANGDGVGDGCEPVAGPTPAQTSEPGPTDEASGAAPPLFPQCGLGMGTAGTLLFCSLLAFRLARGRPQRRRPGGA